LQQKAHQLEKENIELRMQQTTQSSEPLHYTIKSNTAMSSVKIDSKASREDVETPVMTESMIPDNFQSQNTSMLWQVLNLQALQIEKNLNDKD
jgi:hypothetical protein